ncbi:alpha/beta hydrolase [Spirosoma terrae]|uniref:Alpha/beta hydrolase n=1 Tax=Spirosoma terrae TaxID=1968276 RepID=A0A6L9L534_9BACT|nr:macrolide hydrolase EstT [Spirosoma terrae]NDU95604.1 alpha/beta hydrolase [Spirosoma terrae]
MSKKLVRHQDVDLCTESFGQTDKPAILLLAGATVSMLFWPEEFCQRLADKGFFVIRYDNRDVGQSTTYEPGTTPYSIDDLVEDAAAILKAYSLQKAHLVGLSLGGLIAQILTLKYPEKVSTLTLMATGPWGESDPTIPEMDSRIIDFQAKASSVDWANENEVVAYMLEGNKLMSGRKPFDKERNGELIRAEFLRANNYISMFNHAALQGGEEFYGRINEIEQPTLIIHGTDDLIWPVKHANVLLKTINNSTLITLDGTGHELHPADWETIIEAIVNHALAN